MMWAYGLEPLSLIFSVREGNLRAMWQCPILSVMLVNEGGEEIAVERAELGVLWGIRELWFFCEQTNVWALKKWMQMDVWRVEEWWGGCRGGNVMNNYCVPDTLCWTIAITSIFWAHDKCKILYIIISSNPYTNHMRMLLLFSQFFRKGALNNCSKSCS